MAATRRKTRARSKPPGKEFARTAALPENPKPTRRASRPWHIVNRNQLAQLLGVHPETVQTYQRAGMPVLAGGVRGQESLFDAIACATWWRQEKSQVSAKDAAQTRYFAAQAASAEQRHAIQQGQLVPREQVLQEGQAFVKGWSGQLRSIARRARQAGIVQGADNEAALHDLCTQILTDIARWKVPGDAKAAAGPT